MLCSQNYLHMCEVIYMSSDSFYRLSNYTIVFLIFSNTYCQAIHSYYIANFVGKSTNIPKLEIRIKEKKRVFSQQ
jgi:hypothetical protein